MIIFKLDRWTIFRNQGRFPFTVFGDTANAGILRVERYEGVSELKKLFDQSERLSEVSLYRLTLDLDPGCKISYEFIGASHRRNRAARRREY